MKYFLLGIILLSSGCSISSDEEKIHKKYDWEKFKTTMEYNRRDDLWEAYKVGWINGRQDTLDSLQVQEFRNIARHKTRR